MGRLRSVEELFAGRHFDREVIILCVRWYLRYKLSFRDLVEMIAERELDLAHTVLVQTFQISGASNKRFSLRFAFRERTGQKRILRKDSALLFRLLFSFVMMAGSRYISHIPPGDRGRIRSVTLTRFFYKQIDEIDLRY